MSMYKTIELYGPKQKHKKSRVKQYAHKLRNSLPASEVWFNELEARYRFKLPENMFKGLKKDKSNRALYNKLIPDVTNEWFRYVIEIDGGIHTTTRQQRRDRYKDEYYRNNKYFVVRIVAFDEKSFFEGIIKILERRAYFATSPKLDYRQRAWVKRGGEIAETLKRKVLAYAP